VVNELPLGRFLVETILGRALLTSRSNFGLLGTPSLGHQTVNIKKEMGILKEVES
jgi:hypothetical protein